MNEPELGARIRSLRQRKGLSQEALAGRLEVSRQAIAKWESGQSKPSTANLLALCGVFGISLDALVSGEEAATPAPAPAPESRRGRAGTVALSALTLLSLAFSITRTIDAGNRHFPEQIIGGADGPTSILVSGPYLFGLPAEVFPLWVITAVLAVITLAAFLRGRRKK